MGDGKSHSCTYWSSQKPELRALIRLIAELIADDLIAEHRAELSALPTTETQSDQAPPFDNSS